MRTDYCDEDEGNTTKEKGNDGGSGPPLKANVTNFPFSDSGTHLRQKYPIDAHQIEMLPNLPTAFNISFYLILLWRINSIL